MICLAINVNAGKLNKIFQIEKERFKITNLVAQCFKYSSAKFCESCIHECTANRKANFARLL